jgi:hypothetical protein
MTDYKALSPKDVIRRYPALGCVGTLANLRCQKRGIRFFKMGRKVIYRPQDIEAFLFRTPVLTLDQQDEGNEAGLGK